MKTSIATVSISGDFTEKLAAIAAAGFEGIEIFENDFLAYDGSPRDVGRMVADAGLEIALFQPFRDFEGLPGVERTRAFDRAERKFDLMEELGTDLMLVCSNVSPLALGGIDRAATDFHELGERAQRRGLRAGFEALAWGRFINDHRDAWEVVRRANHPAIGLVLDSFHTLARKIDVASIRSIPGDKIFIVQLADAPLIDMDLLYWSRHFRNMPGEGGLPVADFVRAVAATGYDGYLSLEIFNDQFRGGSPKRIAIDGRRALLNLMDEIKRNDPARPIQPAAMPPPVPVEGIEFVEFAADEAEKAELETLFGALGFARAGRHIHKNVTLWRQGVINLLVNTDRDGFAHAAHAMHGTSVCDVGLRVADATATIERARALLAEPFSQPISPGELAIPAVRGVGGGVLHFLDNRPGLSGVWSQEFGVAVDAARPEGVGLVAIDHLGQTMAYEEMLTWVLFYTAIFGARRAPMVDVVDPAGLVRSQAVENEDGSFRITLNGAENHRTLAGHFITENFGSAVQHIAFASMDIFETESRLQRTGFTALPVPANYYDDLGTRFALETGLVERLRAANILYDRDEDGEYFQLYSCNYGEGFFFEIVERRGGYRGYGAPNAPFRIAAQKRQMRPDGMPRG